MYNVSGHRYSRTGVALQPNLGIASIEGANPKNLKEAARVCGGTGDCVVSSVNRDVDRLAMGSNGRPFC